MSKAKKITVSITACIFVILGIFVLFWYFGDTYPQFYAKASKEFEISGLSEGYTPQGLCYEESSKLFLSCGYMKDGSASRIYVTKQNEDKACKYFTLKLDGNDYTGHAGGIETDGHSVWIAGDSKVYRFDFSLVDGIANGDAIDIIDVFDAPNGADFLTIENGNLWIGEFQKDGSYETDESHYVKTFNGTINKALSFCYEIDENGTYGLKSTTPTKALSTPSLVQGMVFTENKIIISTSYSLPNSHIYFYDNTVKDETDRKIDFNGEQITLYILEDEFLLEDMQAPCMSEELALANGRIYVMFESACQKYGAFTREPLRNVYSFEV